MENMHTSISERIINDKSIRYFSYICSFIFYKNMREDSPARASSRFQFSTLALNFFSFFCLEVGYILFHAEMPLNQLGSEQHNGVFSQCVNILLNGLLDWSHIL